MNVCHGLRFYSLCRIHHQQRALARSEAARNFIREIDMPGCIEQVQSIRFAALGRVVHRHRMRFDRNPALPFQIHRIKELILLFSLLDRAGALKQPVRQGRFAVIDMRDDAEVARELNRHESATMRVRRYRVNRGRDTRQGSTRLSLHARLP